MRKHKPFRFATAVTVCVLACMQGAGAATREVTLRNGSKITVLTSDPGTAAKAAVRPCMILPSGPGTEQVARTAMSNLGREFARRNWIVAVPVSPDGRSFFGRNGAMIPELIRVTRKDIGLGYGRPRFSSSRFPTSLPPARACTFTAKGVSNAYHAFG